MTIESTQSPAKDAPAAAGSQGSAIFLRIIVLAVVALGAALLAEAVVTRVGEVFDLPPELVALGVGQIPGAEDQRRITAGNLILQYKHAALWLATVGAILGGLFGLTLGLFRRQPALVRRGLACGVVAGAVFGAASGPLSVWLDRMHREHLPPGRLTVSESQIMLMHGATWLLMGLGCGLGAGVGAMGHRGRAAAGGMIVVGIASLVGGVLFPVVAAVTLPLADSSLPIPDAGTGRLIWIALPALLMGLALGRRRWSTEGSSG